MPTTQPITLPWCLILHLYNTWGLTPNQFGILLIVGIVLIAVCAYLLGSISPSIILSRRVLHDDVRRHGSGNAGTTNMLRNYGAKFAVLTLFLDILKTAIAMGIGYLIYQKDGAALAGLFAVLGHIFPVYYRFHGGKGFACATAVALLMLHPIAFGILFVCYAFILGVTKYVSLSSIMVVLIFPMVQHAFHPDEGTGFLCALMIAVFVVFMHRENIKRLYNREESKIDFSKFRRKKKSADADDDTDGADHE
jgi:glycerol-3-phosphate acyltransferase PlsY